MNRRLTGVLVISLIFVLSSPGISNAKIIFEPAAPVGETFSLPQPASDFIGNLKDISNTVNSRIGQYVNISPFESTINITKINQLNPTQWFQSLMQNPIINSVYSTIVKILQSVGNLVIWILEAVTDLIKQGLAFMR